MKTKAEYIQLLHGYMLENAAKYGISRMGIFGSVARGENTEESDIDILFEGAPISLFTLCRLKSELEKVLGCTVDLLRKRDQLAGSRIEQSINRDLIYV